MPPFREGKIQVDRRFTGEALHELRDIGHGHRVNIVDASYDIPRGSHVLHFAGSSVEALIGVVQLIPIEEDPDTPPITFMHPDEGFEAESDPINFQAKQEFEEVGNSLAKAGLLSQEGRSTGWEYRYGEDGFYNLANNPDEPHVFIRTIDELPFACVSVVAGHSQRLE